jgi:hypothetical protein
MVDCPSQAKKTAPHPSDFPNRPIFVRPTDDGTQVGGVKVQHSGDSVPFGIPFNFESTISKEKCCYDSATLIPMIRQGRTRRISRKGIICCILLVTLCLYVLVGECQNVEAVGGGGYGWVERDGDYTDLL